MYLYWKEFRRAHFIYVPNSVSWHIYRGWDEYGYSRLVLSIGSEEHILDDGEDLTIQYSALSEYAIGEYHSTVVTSIANSLSLAPYEYLNISEIQENILTHFLNGLQTNQQNADLAENKSTTKIE